ncbi:MAG: response regulator [Alcaligenaceae bacterium]|nr:response regulator [Alcaligenaceae bacterium]
MAKILVVDDEIGIRELLREILYDAGHSVELAENASQAREIRLKYQPDLVLLDIWMPDTDGVSLLKEWNSQGLLNMPIIMMSGHATIDTAVEATRIGALDFLEKPITLQKLLKTVKFALQNPNGVQAKPVSNKVVEPTEKASIPKTIKKEPIVETIVQQDKSNMLGNISLDQPLRAARDEFERVYFEYHLAQENHSMTRVSERTGLERTHLYRKLRQLGIDSSKRRKNAS